MENRHIIEDAKKCEGLLRHEREEMVSRYFGDGNFFRVWSFCRKCKICIIMELEKVGEKMKVHGIQYKNFVGRGHEDIQR